jgi:hypothetical protein
MHRGLLNAGLWGSSKDLKNEVARWFFKNWEEPQQLGTHVLTPGEQVRHRLQEAKHTREGGYTWLGVQSGGSAIQKMTSSNSYSLSQ